MLSVFCLIIINTPFKSRATNLATNLGVPLDNDLKCDAQVVESS